MRFWDASAIVPLLVEEPTRETLLGLLDEDSGILIWWGTPVECTSAIARREREGALSVTEATGAVQRLRDITSSWHEILPSEVVRGVAQRLIRVHPLRAADGLQLAAAVVASEREPATLEFVSLDERLSEAASREGFPVIGA